MPRKGPGGGFMFEKHQIYFFSVGGAFSGFLSWAVSAWLPVLFVIPQEEYRIVERLDAICISIAICIFAVFLSYYGHRKMVLILHVIIGVACGFVSGILSSSALENVRPFLRIMHIEILTPICAWFLTGALIGAAIGIIKHYSLLRILLSVAGGSIGALVGGSILTWLGQVIPYMAPVIGLIVTGLFISLFSASASRLAQRATLRLIVSESGPVMEYLSGKNDGKWKLNSKKSYTVGNDGNTGGKYQIFVPDPALSPRHVMIAAENGKFRISACGDCDPNGNIVDVQLYERGKFLDIPNGCILRDGMQVRIGASRFLFQR
jgi:hypothetical protein